MHHERLTSVNGNNNAQSPETINIDEQSKQNKINSNENTNKKAQNAVKANIVVTPASDDKTTVENGAKMAETKNVSTNVRKQDKLELKESDARDNIEETVRWLNGLYEEVRRQEKKREKCCLLFF